MQEYTASMNDLDEALDLLTDATGEIMAGVAVMESAASADTSPEQEALQGLLGQEEYSIDPLYTTDAADEEDNVELGDGRMISTKKE